MDYRMGDARRYTRRLRRLVKRLAKAGIWLSNG